MKVMEYGGSSAAAWTEPSRVIETEEGGSLDEALKFCERELSLRRSGENLLGPAPTFERFFLRGPLLLTQERSIVARDPEPATY